MDAHNDLAPTGAKTAPRATLAIRGKKQPPKIEKLTGDELPPPDRITPAPKSPRSPAKTTARKR